MRFPRNTIMRLTRFRIRTFLIVVAFIAACIGGGEEYFRLTKLSKRYDQIALSFSQPVADGLAELKTMNSQFDTFWASPKRDEAQIELWVHRIGQKRAEVAALTNYVLIYEHAASHPWETPPQAVELNEWQANSPTVQRVAAKSPLLSPPSMPPPPAPPSEQLLTPNEGN